MPAPTTGVSVSRLMTWRHSLRSDLAVLVCSREVRKAWMSAYVSATTAVDGETVVSLCTEIWGAPVLGL